MPGGHALGILCLIAATVFWAFTGLFVKQFSLDQMDADVQNLWRYLAATLGLWPITLLWYRRELWAALPNWRVFLLPAAINSVFQAVMVAGLYQRSIYPGFTSLLGQSSVLFSTVLAFLVFREERATIRSWRYLTGGALALLGATGIIIFGQTMKADFNLGVVLVLTSSLLWSGYTLSMKPTVKVTSPVVSFTIVATLTTAFFVVLTTVRSRPLQFFTAAHGTQFWVVATGLVCISLAHCIYFYAVQQLGVAICASFLLVQPLLTNAASAVYFGERLSRGQLVMAAILLSGAYLVVRAARSPRVAAPPDGGGGSALRHGKANQGNSGVDGRPAGG